MWNTTYIPALRQLQKRCFFQILEDVGITIHHSVMSCNKWQFIDMQHSYKFMPAIKTFLTIQSHALINELNLKFFKSSYIKEHPPAKLGS